MLRIILGVAAGFIVWSIVWVGVDTVLRAISASYDESAKAMSFSSAQLVVPLVLSALSSIIAGYICALVARETTVSTLILGVVLLIVGILVQMSVWDKVQLWYNLAFLILLIPMTILGGKLRKA